MKFKSKLLILVTSITFISVTFALGVPKFGTGQIIAECSHNGEGYGFRTANGNCPGLKVLEGETFHKDNSPDDHTCLETQHPMW
jgi:hypothetical protein